MGRGRVQLRRIENKIRRQVTFSKRRTGLLKKAQEISVLCDVEVALIVFSPKGKLFEFSAGSSMEKILDRYERYSFSRQEISIPNSDLQENCPPECAKLSKMIDVLERSLRHMNGEEVDTLSIRELQSLEMQLDNALKKTRSRKSQLMLDSIAQLQKREKELRNQLAKVNVNKKMRKDNETQDPEQHNSSSIALPSSPPNLSLGGTFQRMKAGKVDSAGTLIRRPTTLPHWMPRQAEA